MRALVVLMPCLTLACGQRESTSAETQAFGHYTRLAESKVKSLKSHIRQASTDVSGVVSPELVAGVLFDEIQQRDWVDDRQDEVARKALDEGAARDDVISDVPRKEGQSLGTVSFGLAQATPDTIEAMFEAGFLWRRFQGYQGGFWDNLRLATTEKMAPFLIAYRLRHIREHWLRGSPAAGCTLDLASHDQGAAILASLYSIGLEGSQGVHCSPKPNDRGRRIANQKSRMSELLGN